jgi:quercetin dioxygenase-like cupin family protein
MRNSIALFSVTLLVPVAICVVAVAQTNAPQITVTPMTAQEVIITGSVRVQSLFDPTEPSRTSGGAVTFQPGARSAWHTHLWARS